MAEEKTRAKMLIEAMRAETRGGKFPPSRRYKPDYHDKLNGDKRFHGVDLEVGSLIICRVYGEAKNEVAGYILCCILDFQESDTTWDRTSNFIVEIVDASNPRVYELVGRLRMAGVEGHGYWARQKYHMVDVGKLKWKEYIPTGSIN